MTPRDAEFTHAGALTGREAHDDRAINELSEQVVRLQGARGDVHNALIHGANLEHAPGQDAPLYGWDVTFDGTQAGRVQLHIEQGTYNAAGNFTPDTNNGEPIYDELAQRYIAASDLLATIRSRVAEQGSRLQEDYVLDRRARTGFPDNRHAMGIETAQTEFSNALNALLANRIMAHPQLNTRERQNQTWARSQAQNLEQMRHLQLTAAHLKSTHRPRGFFNFLRTNRRARLAAGLVLAAGATAATLGGSLAIAGGLTAARTVVAAVGGYESGTAIADMWQSRRARRQHIGRPTTGRVEEGDAWVPAPLVGQVALRRVVRVMGIEARPTNQNADRLNMARQLSNNAAVNYFLEQIQQAGTQNRVFRGARGEQRLAQAGTEIHQREVSGVQLELNRFQSRDARARNAAGYVGALIFGALPGLRAAGILGSELFSSHSHGASHATRLGHGKTLPGRGGAGHGGSPSGSAQAQASKSPIGSNEVNIHGNYNSVYVGNTHPLGDASHLHAAPNQYTHGAIDGASTNVLHVRPGGGFISTFEDQYHLNAAQADKAFYYMHDQLHGAPGTYTYGSDIRISAPGNFKLPTGARAELEHELRQWHKMRPQHLGKIVSMPKPGSAHTAAANISNKIAININGGHDTVAIDTVTGGTGAEQVTVNGHNVSQLASGGLVPQSEAQAYVHEMVRNRGITGMSANAQSAIQKYIESSIDRPVTGSYAIHAQAWIHHMWEHQQHMLRTLGLADAEKLEDNLAVINTA